MTTIKVIPTASGIKFWASVKRGPGCWIWTKSVGSHGYGQFYVERGQPLQAHRVSWFLLNGRIPTGMQVLHKCDVKRCVRPDHLFLGTQADNMKDMCAKGRHARVGPAGESATNAKLKTKDIIGIRRRFVGGTRQRPGNATTLAQEFHVSRTLIYLIAKRKAWKHVP